MPEVDPFQRALERWRQERIQVSPPADLSEIEGTFSKLNYPLSDDVRRLYQLANGFKNYDMDKLWTLWPLERIIEENQEYSEQPKDVLWFSDFLISSHLFGLKHKSTETSAVVVSSYVPNEPSPLVAESLEEFITKYLDDPWSVEIHWSPTDDELSSPKSALDQTFKGMIPTIWRWMSRTIGRNEIKS